jgi:phosphoribosylglycinamide formyltransferase-1
MKTPIAIFASGRGSNFDAIATAVQAGKLSAEIVAVVSDQPNAPVLEKAKKLGLNAICVPFDGAQNPDKAQVRLEHDKKILAELSVSRPRFLVLAGYMRIVTPHLIESFRSEKGYSRIVNVHPSLKPKWTAVRSVLKRRLQSVIVSRRTK